MVVAEEKPDEPRRRVTPGRVLAGLILLVLIGVLPALHIHWRRAPIEQLDLLVFDVTVADDRYMEHAVIDRIFAHQRVSFRLGVDHVGAAPGGAPHGEWPTEQPELIVLAEGYGVYADDDGEIDDLGRNRLTAVLSEEQAADVERWVEAGVPAYGELAIAPEPTPVEASESLQRAFGLDTTGWLGSPVEDLAELSPGLKALGPDPWPYEGPGLFLVTTTSGHAAPDRRLVVLTADELEFRYPYFVGGPEGSRGDRASFPRWFELVEPNEGSEVEAWIELPVNDDGRRILDSAGVPARWPGVVSTDNTVYVAADGLEDATGFSFKQFTGGDWLSWKFDNHPRERFFHQILFPSIDGVVAQARQRRAMAAVDEAD